MFGYIKTYTPELKIRENEYYKGVYCGLCHALKKRCGFISRLTLSYDFVFMVLVRSAATDLDIGFKNSRCIAHPLSDSSVAEINDELDFAAICEVLLYYYKCMDDIADEKGKKRLRAKFIRLILNGSRRRILKSERASEAAELDKYISETMKKLYNKESEHAPSVDTTAEIFGELTAYIFSYGLCEDKARIVRNIGRHIGRWIYIVDACDDYKQDKASNSYNPFIYLYEGEDFDDEKKLSVKTALLAELCEIEKSLDLIDLEKSSDICGVLKNIIYLGMPDVSENILFPKSKNNTQINS